MIEAVSDLDAIRELHWDSGGECAECGMEWPCDVSLFIARVAELEAALRLARRAIVVQDSGDMWIEADVLPAIDALLARPEPKP